MIFLQQQPSGLGIVNLLFFLSVFMIFYFFFMRPASKKQAAQKSFTDELSKGDEVVTSSGMIARINKVEDNIVHLQIDQKTFIRVVKAAISKEMTEQYNKGLTNS